MSKGCSGLEFIPKEAIATLSESNLLICFSINQILCFVQFFLFFSLRIVAFLRSGDTFANENDQ